MDFDPEPLGWRTCFQEQVTDDEIRAGWYPARVCRGQARRCHVWSRRGVHALEAALFGKEGLPTVGDWLLLDPAENRPPRCLERFNALERQAPGSRLAIQPLAANVDTLLIVTACNEEFSESRIERYLALAAQAQCKPVVVLTKPDLTDKSAEYVTKAQSLTPLLRVECFDARDPGQLVALVDLCAAGQTVAALGSSGVGKSTLTNGLSDAAQVVGAVRGDDNKGKHTTTSRSLHRLNAGGVFVDLPGIRELQLVECAEGIDATFAEIAALLPECRFSNCRHEGDPGCALEAALIAGQITPRRMESYRKLRDEQESFTAKKKLQDKRLNRRTR